MPTNTKEIILNGLTACHSALNTYGKQLDDLPATTEVFYMVLSNYTDDDIQAAFMYWIQNESNFPTPADIRKTISSKYENDREYQRLVHYRNTGGTLSQKQRETVKRIEAKINGTEYAENEALEWYK